MVNEYDVIEQGSFTASYKGCEDYDQKRRIFKMMVYVVALTLVIVGSIFFFRSAFWTDYWFANKNMTIEEIAYSPYRNKFFIFHIIAIGSVVTLISIISEKVGIEL